jgi:hypothetical protein
MVANGIWISRAAVPVAKLIVAYDTDML